MTSTSKNDSGPQLFHWLGVVFWNYGKILFPTILFCVFYSIVDTVGNPVTQRLLAALLEEKVMEIVPKGSENGEKKPDRTYDVMPGIILALVKLLFNSL